MSLLFVTSNEHKKEEVSQSLSYRLQTPEKLIDIPEIQGSIIDIARHKALEAAKAYGTRVLVEDTALCFDIWGGMPGPYVKYFLENLSPLGLANTLDTFADKAATAICTFAIAGPDDTLAQVLLFQGKTKGTIVHPRGPQEFGWDAIFEPRDGDGSTFAEMGKQAKALISHRSRALDRLRAYLSDQTSS